MKGQSPLELFRVKINKTKLVVCRPVSSPAKIVSLSVPNYVRLAIASSQGTVIWPSTRFSFYCIENSKKRDRKHLFYPTLRHTHVNGNNFNCFQKQNKILNFILQIVICIGKKIVPNESAAHGFIWEPTTLYSAWKYCSIAFIWMVKRVSDSQTTLNWTAW